MDKIIGMGNALVDALAVMESDALLTQLNLPKGSMQLINKDTFHTIRQEADPITVERSTGGSTGNMVLALGNLGVQPAFIGKIGKDEAGEFYRNSLQNAHIDTRLILSDLPTGIVTALVDAGGERTFATYLGAAASLSAEELSAEFFQGYSYFYIEGYLVQDHSLILRAVQLAKEAGLHICLDMASYNIVEEDKSLFDILLTEYVDIVFANEQEAFAFTGKCPEEALPILAQKCSVAIVKLGKDGSIVQKGTETVVASPVVVEKVVDTTGAGDYYAAGFLYALTQGYNLQKCARIGSILSAEVIQHIGTTLSTETWDKVKNTIQEVLQES